MSADGTDQPEVDVYHTKMIPNTKKQKHKKLPPPPKKK